MTVCPRGSSLRRLLATTWHTYERWGQRRASWSENQHVVSRVVLKGFAAPGAKGAGWQLTPFDVHRRNELKSRGLRGCGKISNFLTFAPASAEHLWNKGVENKLDSAINAGNDDSMTTRRMLRSSRTGSRCISCGVSAISTCIEAAFHQLFGIYIVRDIYCRCTVDEEPTVANRVPTPSRFTCGRTRSAQDGARRTDRPMTGSRYTRCACQGKHGADVSSRACDSASPLFGGLACSCWL